MNEQEELILSAIKKQIEELNNRYVSLSIQNKELRTHTENLEQNANNQHIVIDQLNNQLQLLKLTNFADRENENEKNELKKTINEYIKEIDNCIKLLNR